MLPSTHTVGRLAGRLIDTRAKRFSQAWLSRPFGFGSGPRVLIYYKTSPICWSQIYPFLYYERQFGARFSCQIRYRPIEDFLARKAGPVADIIFVQPWFTDNPAQLSEAFDALATAQPNATISFLDSFAHNDLRLGSMVDPYISAYFKKSLFVDRQMYLRDFKGDTNLTEFYGDLYGIEQGAPVAWNVPPGLLDKLHTCANFFTAPRFITAFAAAGPRQGPRTIDVQSRLGAKGTPWYTAMRNEAQDRIKSIPDLVLSPPGQLSLADFMAELENSKLCFSPFGYGELCWRDIEAFQTGATLIKPDMGHLETSPDLYEAGETYLPVKWDFSDLQEVVEKALADDALRAHIAQTAYDRIKSYLEQGDFVSEMSVVFE